MPASLPRRDRPPRYTARLLIKLDAVAQATFETLCTTSGRLPPQVLRQLIDWGLDHGERWQVDHQRVANPTGAVVVRLEPAVRTRVHAAARAAGADASAWVCHLLQQVTLKDLPPHWQTGEADPHSHDSRYDGKRSMMRLDKATWDKLEALSKRLGTSIAEVIRELVAHAEMEDVPATWQRGVDP